MMIPVSNSPRSCPAERDGYGDSQIVSTCSRVHKNGVEDWDTTNFPAKSKLGPAERMTR